MNNPEIDRDKKPEVSITESPQSSGGGWNAPYYQTECEHRVKSYHRCACIHGSLTSATGNPLGRRYEGVLVSAKSKKESADV